MDKINQFLIGKTISSLTEKNSMYCEYDKREYEASQKGLTVTFTDGTKVTFQSKTNYSDLDAWVEVEEEK